MLIWALLDGSVLQVYKLSIVILVTLFILSELFMSFVGRDDFRKLCDLDSVIWAYIRDLGPEERREYLSSTQAFKYRVYVQRQHPLRFRRGKGSGTGMKVAPPTNMDKTDGSILYGTKCSEPAKMEASSSDGHVGGEGTGHIGDKCYVCRGPFGLVIAMHPYPPYVYYRYNGTFTDLSKAVETAGVKGSYIVVEHLCMHIELTSDMEIFESEYATERDR